MATRTTPALNRLTPAVGAVIDGVQLGDDLDSETLGFVQKALLDHGVVFLRNQQASVESLWGFLENFGTPWKEDSFGSDDDGPEDVADFDFLPTRHGTAIWHSDSSFLAEPPKITLLRALSLPEIGGDTCWASMTAAYDALYAPLRAMLDDLTAVHSIDVPMGRMGEYGDVFRANFEERHASQQVHPVVAVHPETGRKALYVTESCTNRIVGLSPHEGRHLLAMLFEHIKSPDFNLRWRWSENDIALWDNRSVQHYAVPDYDSPRVVQRIIVAGERPKGPGG
ncbi:MAG: TauD/TfdA family dioxygenase [Novosphingobium sp.]|nr:TauD/TfdA family dioxygenase [Novosphingobium sp.]